MKTLLNIIWFLFAGLWLAIAYVFFGLIACIFIITIPAGVASFRMASFVVWPFGRTLVQPVNGSGALSGVSNVIWFFVAGLWLAVGHLTTAASLAVTIIGLPMAWANLKLIPVTCFPFGKKIVDSDHIPAGYEPVVKM